MTCSANRVNPNKSELLRFSVAPRVCFWQHAAVDAGARFYFNKGRFAGRWFQTRRLPVPVRWCHLPCTRTFVASALTELFRPPYHWCGVRTDWVVARFDRVFPINAVIS